MRILAFFRKNIITIIMEQLWKIENYKLILIQNLILSESNSYPSFLYSIRITRFLSEILNTNFPRKKIVFLR